MRIVFAGTPALAVPSLAALLEAGHEVVGVITRPDAPLGRKRILTPSPVAEWANTRSLPILKTAKLDDSATRWVAELKPDLGVIVAYGGLVREPLLTLPREGWINLHFSTLPKWRGAAPVQRALQAGEQRLGISVFRLVEELDAGAVLSRAEYDFPPGTSAGDALAKLAELGTAALLHGVARAATGDPGEPQTGEPSYAAKLARADGQLRFAQAAPAVLAHWAGVTPEPGAFGMLDGQPVKLLQLAPCPTQIQQEAAAAATAPSTPGTVRLQGKHAILYTGDGLLLARRVQPAGKGAMDAAAWLRGRGGEAVLR